MEQSKNGLQSPDETTSPSVTNTMSATPIPEDDAVPLNLDGVMEPTQSQEEEKLDHHSLYHRNRHVSISGLAIHDPMSRKKSELIRMGKIYWREMTEEGSEGENGSQLLDMTTEVVTEDETTTRRLRRVGRFCKDSIMLDVRSNHSIEHRNKRVWLRKFEKDDTNML